MASQKPTSIPAFSFLRLDSEAVQHLKEAWDLIEPEIETILGNFYEHLFEFSGNAKHHRGQEPDRPPHQGAEGPLENRSSTNPSGEAFLRQGPRRRPCTSQKSASNSAGTWAGTASFSSVCPRPSAAATGFRASRANALVAAVQKVVFLDMDLALSVYNDLVREDRERGQRRRTELIAEFDSEATGMIDGMTSAASSMEKAAKRHGPDGQTKPSPRRAPWRPRPEEMTASAGHGRGGDRGTVDVGQRDQPTSRPFRPHRRRGGPRSRAHFRNGRRIGRGGRQDRPGGRVDHRYRGPDPTSWP